MIELKPCPWQKENEPCKLEIAVLDDEGNYYGEPGCDYEQDPFSGGPWYTLDHSGCSAGEYSFGKFSSVDKLIEAWNTRAERTCKPLYFEYGEGPCCSECGRRLHYDEHTERDYPPYCGCGAKVVE